jgi:hypothetical protein
MHISEWRVSDSIASSTLVTVPIPSFVVDALEGAAAVNDNPDYFFWTGRSHVTPVLCV